MKLRFIFQFKEYPALASQVIGSSVSFSKGEEGREITNFFTKLDTLNKDRRLVVSRVLKSQKDSVQLSFLEGDEFDSCYFVTNAEMPSKKVVIAYEKHGKAESYLKEAKYDMVVGHLLLRSFWANEAIFQSMMLAYNLFLLFKMDFANGTEYWLQIKTFRLKCVFLAGKIIRTVRSVIMKLSEKYPNREVYAQSFAQKGLKSRFTSLLVFKSGFKMPNPCLIF